eukprot:3439402-Amphidinium_carterae.1
MPPSGSVPLKFLFFATQVKHKRGSVQGRCTHTSRACTVTVQVYVQQPGNRLYTSALTEARAVGRAGTLRS